MDFKFSLTVTVLLILFFSVSCSSVRGVKRATGDALMYGMVYNNENMPVTSAQVVVDGRVATITDAQGRFFLSSRQRKEFTLSLVKTGYETVTGTFRFEPMEVIHIVMINADQLITLAEFAMDEGRFRDVIRFCDRAFALDPERIDAVYLKTLSLVRLREFDNARQILLELEEKIGEREYINWILERLPQ